MSKIKSLIRSARETHNDERGLEALQVVMIIAIAAVCLIVVKNQWPEIKKWFEAMMSGAIGEGNWDSGKGGGTP